jgi:hypothetical protein
MAHVTIEYMIFVPVLILQIFLFPIAATAMMNSYADSRMTLQLKQISGDLGSSMQQLYFTMNHNSIASGTVTSGLTVPTIIQDGNNVYSYLITLTNATSPQSSVQVMNLTLSLVGAKATASSIVTLGNNANWPNNANYSSVLITQLTAIKSSGGIALSFGGS